jgi:hypothetical protein
MKAVSKRRILSFVFVLASLFVTPVYPHLQTFSAQPVLAPAIAATPGISPQVAGDLFIRTELFFGSRKPDGTEVTSKQWKRFLNQEITPRFPDGLTVLTGSGQFRDSSGEIIKEKATLLILLYPLETQAESSEKIEQIREAYKLAFQQESVLRADDLSPLSVSF